jgi:hypothetical protein
MTLCASIKNVWDEPNGVCSGSIITLDFGISGVKALLTLANVYHTDDFQAYNHERSDILKHNLSELSLVILSVAKNLWFQG